MDDKEFKTTRQGPDSEIQKGTEKEIQKKVKIKTNAIVVWSKFKEDVCVLKYTLRQYGDNCIAKCSCITLKDEYGYTDNENIDFENIKKIDYFSIENEDDVIFHDIDDNKLF